jgi:phage replication-related protein YjqB (UPF0714/DUF867 family)
MAADLYNSYADLMAAEREGIDYRIVSLDRGSPVTIIAPHGGYIEPPSSRLALAIAADDYNAYCFDGLEKGRDHHELHITSESFDEPIGCALIAKSDTVIALHGRRDREEPKTVWIGGRDGALCDAIASHLGQAGFETATEGHEFPALSLANICNRGRRKQGVQIEIPRSLRDILIRDRDVFNQFANAIRLSIANVTRVESADPRRTVTRSRKA